MKYPKLKPGVFLFDRSTGFIVQVIHYSSVVRDDEDTNILYITRPARSIADACIDYTELRENDIHDFLVYIRTQKLLTIVRDKVYTFISSSTLIDVSKPSSHKFLRKDSFFEDYRVSETWAKRNNIPLNATWRTFTAKARWDCSDFGAINYKMYQTRVGAQGVVKSFNEILNSGITQLFRTNLDI